jgi:hypothetical protein
MALFYATGMRSNERRPMRSFMLAVTVIFFSLAVLLRTTSLAADDRFQEMVNYIFTGSTAPQDPPEIANRDSCVVLVHEPQFNRYARYYLTQFKMDTARITKTYAGSKVLYELEVDGDDILVEYLKTDNRTVDYGFRSAHIPLPGDIEQTERALRMIFADHCKAAKPKPPF